MIIDTASVFPFDNEKLEIRCSFDEKGHFSGPGKIIDFDGSLLCEGIFVNVPDQDHMSISLLESGTIFINGQELKVSNFDGQNGNGVIVKGYTGLVGPVMPIKVGHFVDGELDGLGVDINTVATLEKGEFKRGRLVKGLRSSNRGRRHEIYAEYDYYDYTNQKAKGKVEYRGEGDVLEGEFSFGGGTMITRGTLLSTVRTEDCWRGEFFYSNNHWVLVNGTGKWDGFEGEVENKVPVNAHGRLVDYNSSLYYEAFFVGRWESGLFNGEWIGPFEYPKVCPRCGKEMHIWDDGNCKDCGHQSPFMSHRREYIHGEIVREWDEIKNVKDQRQKSTATIALGDRLKQRFAKLKGK